MSSQLTVNASNLFEQFRTELLPIVAETGQSFDRLKSTFLIAVEQSPGILECTPESIRREIKKCASDGLVPDNKEAAMIPYKGVIQYQPMVYGIIKRVKELGGVFSIVCNLVFEKDEFVVNEADPDSLVHKSDRFAKDRGEVVGGYAIFRDDAKRVMHLEIMSSEDFEKVRKASKAPNSPAWRDWRDEMYKKAVLRRGAKYIAVNNDKIRELIERQDALYDFQSPRQDERVNPFGGATIDLEANKQPEKHAERHEDRRQTRNDTQPDTRQRRQDDRAPAGNSDDFPGDQPSNQTQAEPKNDSPPVLPELMIKKEDHVKAVEAASKLLKIVNEPNLDAPGRRGILKTAAPMWKEETPEYLHPLIKACVDMTDWALKRDAAGQPWSAEHAMFVHKTKELLEVEKLEVGRYP